MIGRIVEGAGIVMIGRIIRGVPERNGVGGSGGFQRVSPSSTSREGFCP